MLKIDSCLIVKNEEENIKKLIEQLLIFSDEIHITDTGSTDNTINIINEFVKNNSNVYLHHFEWTMNFSEAKNYSLTCYDVKADYQFWCDGDDLLTDNLLKKIKTFKEDPQVVNEMADIYYMNYMYNKFCSNPRSTFHVRTSLLKVSSNLKWFDPIHEYIAINNLLVLNTSYFDSNNDEYIEHQRKHYVGSRNLDIFMNMEKTGWKFDSRNYYYYMAELFNNGYTKLSYYIGIECIYFDDDNIIDKINAARLIKNIQQNKGFTSSFNNISAKQAIEYLFNKFGEDNIRGDLLYDYADIFYNEKNYDEAEKYYKKAYEYKLPTPLYGFLYNDTETKINSLLQLNMVAYYHHKDMQECIKYNRMILNIDPNNETAKNNISIVGNNNIN